MSPKGFERCSHSHHRAITEQAAKKTRARTARGGRGHASKRAAAHMYEVRAYPPMGRDVAVRGALHVAQIEVAQLGAMIGEGLGGGISEVAAQAGVEDLELTTSMRHRAHAVVGDACSVLLCRHTQPEVAQRGQVRADGFQA